MSLAVSGPIVWLPESALLPVQMTEALLVEAEQEVAFDEDQVSVTESPLTTDVALAVIDTPGTGGGGGNTTNDALPLPPEPVQVRE